MEVHTIQKNLNHYFQIRHFMNKRIVRLIIYVIVGFAAAFLYRYFKK